ncbi:hypothetical protein COL154_014129, partial [Colletotrichum chrysophilum]
ALHQSVDARFDHVLSDISDHRERHGRDQGAAQNRGPVKLWSQDQNGDRRPYQEKRPERAHAGEQQRGRRGEGGKKSDPPLLLLVPDGGQEADAVDKRTDDGKYAWISGEALGAIVIGEAQFGAGDHKHGKGAEDRAPLNCVQHVFAP